MDWIKVEIVQTRTFSRQVDSEFGDKEYSKLEAALARDPEQGVLIPGGGGIRKLRWARQGKGKRGGYRIIYYWASMQCIVLFLYMYPKSEQEDLTQEQIKLLRHAVKEEYT